MRHLVYKSSRSTEPLPSNLNSILNVHDCGAIIADPLTEMRTAGGPRQVTHLDDGGGSRCWAGSLPRRTAAWVDTTDRLEGWTM